LTTIGGDSSAHSETWNHQCSAEDSSAEHFFE
jgi:hypothetical protein